jgi:CBS-domain-containing membrane protein
MRLQDIMSRDIKTIASGASVIDARNAMRTSGVRHLLVVNNGRGVVGIVSERDLGGRLGASGAKVEGLSVADLMTERVVTARPETTIRQAANLLRGHIIGCVVVMDETKAVGIVTTTDLLDLIGRGAERPIDRSTRWTLRSRGARRSTPRFRHARRG